MPSYLLECQNISKTYPGIKALNSIQFSLGYGEIHALIGENGAGKSTFIKILSGIEEPDKGGNIYIEGEIFKEITPLTAMQKGISVIYQDLSLLGNLSVGENLFLGKLLEENSFLVNWKNLQQVAAKVLAEISLDIEPKTLVESLSIGKQQMLAIAKALVLNTKILIMDEPTSALSSREVEDLFQVIASLRAKGISIIFISHKLDELFRVCGKFTVLRDGAYMGTFDKEDLTEQRLINLMVGRNVEYFIHPKRNRQTEDVVLEVKELAKKKHFADISFRLHRGEMLGFYGMVGAGRTELMQVIFGIEEVESGSVYVNGRSVNITSPAQARALGLSYVPEDRLNEGLFLTRSIHENLIITSDFINKLRWRKILREEQVVAEQMSALHIVPKQPQMLAEQLSGGNKQKVVIGKWLAIHPMIMIVDEPTNGMDIAAKVEVHKLLRTLSGEGVSIIVVSSEMNEVISICDRLIVMSCGRISGELTEEQISQENIMQYAAIGLQQIRA